VPDAEILQETGKSRYSLRRWRRGESFPERQAAEALIALFARYELELPDGQPYRLDFNGCYEKSLEVPDDADFG